MATPDRADRPLSARSVIASTLLGLDPPRMRAQLLVRSGELFGLAPGTTRTALSRMVADGELVNDGGRYALSGRLLDRQRRQTESRAPRRRAWDGTFVLAIVVGDARAAGERAELRVAMRRLRLVEWREGVWARPDNLDLTGDRESWSVADRQCAWVTGASGASVPVDRFGAERWARRARALEAEMAVLVDPLDRGDLDVLADGFVVSATVQRHLGADPLLPDELVGDGWPGPDLRAAYDRYQEAFRTAHRVWFRAQR